MVVDGCGGHRSRAHAHPRGQQFVQHFLRVGGLLLWLLLLLLLLGLPLNRLRLLLSGSGGGSRCPLANLVALLQQPGTEAGGGGGGGVASPGS